MKALRRANAKLNAELRAERKALKAEREALKRGRRWLRRQATNGETETNRETGEVRGETGEVGGDDRVYCDVDDCSNWAKPGLSCCLLHHAN